MAKSKARFQIFFVFLVVMSLHFLIQTRLFEYLCFCPPLVFARNTSFLVNALSFLPIVFLLKNIFIYPCNHITSSPIRWKLLEKATLSEKEWALLQSVKKLPKSHCSSLTDSMLITPENTLKKKGTWQKRVSKPTSGTFLFKDCFTSSCS